METTRYRSGDFYHRFAKECSFVGSAHFRVRDVSLEVRRAEGRQDGLYERPVVLFFPTFFVSISTFFFGFPFIPSFIVVPFSISFSFSSLISYILLFSHFYFLCFYFSAPFLHMFYFYAFFLFLFLFLFLLILNFFAAPFFLVNFFCHVSQVFCFSRSFLFQFLIMVLFLLVSWGNHGEFFLRKDEFWGHG